MKIMVTPFTRSQAGTATLSAPTLQQATTDPRLCQRLLDTHRQAWVSLLWGHCSFLQGPGVHKVFLLPSKSLLSSPILVLKEVTIIFIISTIVWSQVKQQGGNTALPINRKLD